MRTDAGESVVMALPRAFPAAERKVRDIGAQGWNGQEKWLHDKPKWS
jgi:hypothetical protein